MSNEMKNRRMDLGKPAKVLALAVLCAWLPEQ